MTEAKKAEVPIPSETIKTWNVEDWRAEAVRRFGDDPMKWRFVCLSCGHIQTPSDYKSVGAPETSVAFSCVGRWTPGATGEIWQKGKGPCNYAGGGMFRLNPVRVTEGEQTHEIFDFAQ
jgi:hypothetical protein